ncbi:metalloendopeptidase inhibitor [Porites harrisoni]
MESYIFAFLLGNALFTTGFCRTCSCLPRHPQNDYCNSAFVIRAKVLSKSTEEPLLTESTETAVLEKIPVEFIQEQVYTLRILKIYKGAMDVKETNGAQVYGSRRRTWLAKLYTTPNASSCNVPLRNNTVYLLTGQILNKKLRTGSCNWRTEWSEITRKQRAGIRRFYGENCMCQVGLCFGSNCSKMLQGCHKVDWRAPMKETCKSKNSYCVRDWGGNACAWRITSEYKKCLKRIP